MRRWNGWGDDSVAYPLPDSARSYLHGILPPGTKRQDAPFEEVLSRLPASELPDHDLIVRDPALRLRHARGQSLPDWIALRAGRPGAVPDAIAFPETKADVRALLRYAGEHSVQLIPYGGGTSVVGHVNPLPEHGPALTVSMRKMSRLLDVDMKSRLATIGAGATGPEIEAQLRAHGLTLGHFPQSWEYSTLGGWIATRSSGQQSYFYGRIEDLLRGASLEAPAESLSFPLHPASAAGPDLRQCLLGSEGRMGLITRATMRVRPLPMRDVYYAAFFPNWSSGVAAARTIGQNRVRLSMLRLSDAQETETTLALTGHKRLISLAGKGLRMLGHGPERCMMIYGLTGDSLEIRKVHSHAKEIFRAHGGLPVGTYIGRAWEQARFRSAYLRNTLWEHGYALDTLESAVQWSSFDALRNAVMTAIHQEFNLQSVPALVFSHLSHLYEDGVSFYLTYLFPLQADPEHTLQLWRRAKGAASEAIVSEAGTISHQHGVGIDHRDYLAEEKSPTGMAALQAFVKVFDPNQILNPGKLLL